MAKFPKTLYVKIERDGKLSYPVAASSLIELAELGETIPYAVYHIAETGQVSGAAKASNVRRSR
jgi:hypothetical protein